MARSSASTPVFTTSLSGQRKGLGVATGSPLYVIQIRGDKRQVVVGERKIFIRELCAPGGPTDFRR